MMPFRPFFCITNIYLIDCQLENAASLSETPALPRLNLSVLQGDRLSDWNSFFAAGLERLGGRPSRLASDLGRVHRMAAIMAGTIGNEFYLLAIRAAISDPLEHRRHEQADIADQFLTVDAGLL
jgi:hypothetical protein